MIFIEMTRELSSETGYLKEKETGIVYSSHIYLGKYSVPTDYEECQEADYLAYLENIKKQEKEFLSQQETQEVVENTNETSPEIKPEEN